VRIVVADDSLIVREWLATALGEAGFEVVAAVGEAGELLDRVATERPDLAILDIRMPPTYTDEGLRAAQQIRARHRSVAVLLLSQYVQTAQARWLIEEGAGGIGYLLKDRIADRKDLIAAVRRVAGGGVAVDPEVVSRLFGRPRRADPLERLTAREREVLSLMAEGLSNRGIAERLHVTDDTVESHVRSVFLKLGLLPVEEENRRVRAVLRHLEAAG
jgi:serine/threonine-protein kinase